MTKKTRPRGRPKGSTADKTLETQLPVVRVSKDQLRQYKEASERDNQAKNFSSWVRNILDKASNSN